MYRYDLQAPEVSDEKLSVSDIGQNERLGLPLNRETYLTLDRWELNPELDPEEEAALRHSSEKTLTARTFAGPSGPVGRANHEED